MKLKCGLVGEHLAHSFSPQIHAELGDYEYVLYEKRADELESFIRDGEFDGLTVTIPYKKAVIPFCSNLSDTARAIGSVNVLTRQPDGSLCGDNTDYFGFDYLLSKSGADPAGGKTLVLGSGGSSLTVQAVLRSRSAKEVVVISRSGADNYENIGKHSDAIIIVNTTPVGMYPGNGASPLKDLSIFDNCKAVIDIVYNPAMTELLLQAADRGITAVGGLAMLSAQAKKAAELFTGTAIPDGIIETITSKIVRKTRNIVLIGMPGSGKTSIGIALGKLMDREFCDTDALIIKKTGKEIPAIFDEYGEDSFREMETEVLRDMCKRSGLIIATGGGVVKRRENLRIIRQNSTLVFLDRDISELTTFGRPLSQRDGIAALSKERLPIYKQWGEYTVAVSGIDRTAAEIYERLMSGD